MEKKLNFTNQALNQINKIAVGKDKKYFRLLCREVDVLDLNIVLALIQKQMKMISFLIKP